MTLSNEHAASALHSSEGQEAVAWADPVRRQQFEAWFAPLAAQRGLDPANVVPASTDASFRRYLRASGDQGSCIVMDAPPEHEDCRPFVHVAALLRRAGLNVPQVHAWDEQHGFMLLSDLGSTTYLARLHSTSADSTTSQTLYRDALNALVVLQAAGGADDVPAYDEALLRREMGLFADWYVARHIGTPLTDARQADLERALGAIVDNNLAQPRCLVHRDYHSRNLMVSDPNPGILDFQDAVFGPVTYDLVSLLRDAYIEWDEDVQIDYAARYWDKARKAGLAVQSDFGEFWRDFEWMGLQRHLKVLGIFARLAYRDGKTDYLASIPRVWAHAHRVCRRYSALGRLGQLLEEVSPPV